MNQFAVQMTYNSMWHVSERGNVNLSIHIWRLPVTSGNEATINGPVPPAAAIVLSFKLSGSFTTYFPRVLRHVHKGLSPSQKTMSVMDSFIKDVFEHIADEASRLARSNKCSTIMSREIQTAMRLLLPREIGKHAVSEATKAITRYTFRQ
uniref:Late histone H2B.L4-like n=1 Tax=Callorhinus ursinus TaxID=34884 RepID=A0A3Q7N8J1_CALUR|nr:late histone H2B.L4-like [Callorhinus ursinus]